MSVRDRGHGIPSELLDKVFERFFSTDADETGLGLAIDKSVALAHGGSVHVESELSVGSTFRLQLHIAAR